MAFDLRAILAPGQTAVLTSECQEGIIGETSRVGPIVEAVRACGMVPRLVALLDAARSMHVPVVHCTVVRRDDGGGSSANCRLLAFARAGKGGGLAPGSDAARVLAALGPAADDYVLARHHGISPFHGSELDQLLRNLGVRTVVATGVSLNVALLGLIIEAVNAGYQVVLPRDAAAGAPPAYVEMLLAHTLSLLATVTTVADVIAVWRG